MAILPRYKRLRRRDWKDPFSWFNWYKRANPEWLFSYRPGVDPRDQRATFTRADASTCATYIDGAGVVQTVAANIPRYQHYDPANPSLGPLLLLEGSRTNTVTYSAAMSDASWGMNALTSRNLDAVGPDGATNTACTLIASGANAWVRKLTGTATTAGGTATISAFVKKSNCDYCWIEDGGDAVNHVGWFNLTTGAVGSTSAAITSRIQSLGTGYYRVSLTYTTTNAYNQRLSLGIARTNAATDSASGDTIIASFAQGEVQAAFPSSYIPTTSAAVTRAADALSFPFLAGPQAMTVYADCLGVSPSTAANNTIFTIGDTGVADRFAIARFDSSSAGRVRTGQNNGTTTVLSDAASTATFGDRVEAMLQIAADGAVTATTSKNAGTAVVGTASAANALSAAWKTATLTLANEPPYHALRSLKVAAGVRDMFWMRNRPA